MEKTDIMAAHLRIGIRTATCVVTEICGISVALENSVNSVCGDLQTYVF